MASALLGLAGNLLVTGSPGQPGDPPPVSSYIFLLAVATAAPGIWASAELGNRLVRPL